MELSNYADRVVEKLWEDFKNVVFKETSKREYVLQEKWYDFPCGTNRETIWNWFDQRYSKGVIYLMYQMNHRRQLCAYWLSERTRTI